MMLVDLVRIRTSDGVRLDGAQQEPMGPPGSASSLDAVVCLSGVGGNFYSSTLLTAVTEPLLRDGLVVLHVNTRGHDGVSTAVTDSGAHLQGAAYETIDDCQHDVHAWVDFLAMQGFRRIGLLGHSLGAVKALYAQARQPHGAVAQIVAVSPPCLAYRRFLQGRDSAAFRESLAVAERLVDEGQPRMLFRATFPFPLVISATTFLDKYGPEERYNFLHFAPSIACPLTFIYGAQELADGGSALAGLLPEIEQLRWPGHRPRTVVVDDADHFYRGQQEQLAHEVSLALQADAGGPE